jgi:glycosyltransferase involved in cell wall biosynthesis
MSARPTVMHVVLNLMAGGTERLVVELARRTRDAVQPVVCCLEGRGPLAAELDALDIPVLELNRTAGFHPSLGRRLGRAAADCGAALLHCHQYSPFVYGVIAARLHRGLGVVFTEHGRATDAPVTFKRRVANAVVGRAPASIFAVSGALRDHLIDEGFPASRVAVIHNGIELGPRVSALERAAVRRELGLPAGALVFGTVARLDPVKDLASLVDAFARVRSTAPASHLLIVGDGPEQAALAAQVQRAGLGHAVTFAGFRADARRLLPAIDVYVNSSVYEGIPLTVLEAMAASLPVVATAVGGTSEVVAADTGLLVGARDAEGMAAAMRTLAASIERRTGMGARGRARVEALFSIERMVSRYLTAYDETLVDRPLMRSPACVVSAGPSR